MALSLVSVLLNLEGEDGERDPLLGLPAECIALLL